MRNFTFSSLALISLYSVMLADSFGQAQPPPPPAAPILSVYGAVARADADGAAHFDLEMLRALPAAQLETTTAVTDGVRRFDGVLMRDLLAHVGAQGKTLTARALNDYAIDIAIEEFDRFDVLVAYEMDGEPLLPSDKGPLWIVYPRDRHAELQDIRFDYRWVWQLRWIEIR
ncbi:molybdopterin-dependent oxidoreductase [Aquamicrobium defluvii]|uniref:Oxidoreductase molybdopterin-binding domain-containing protein n=1 Tax=Aquamicrobium defluvii TaxID=69279 RepID=A0A011UXJ9_9HYPH|nr:molybdopterin-dependent oxidoreductase [Aquamicrobium defluvii]EXL10603.1 hypothetical protein BG36_01860 [Aquamicrobium defluvii]